jgi:hypothetical protein
MTAIRRFRSTAVQPRTRSCASCTELVLTHPPQKDARRRRGASAGQQDGECPQREGFATAGHAEPTPALTVAATLTRSVLRSRR